ncbi:ROK family transcriptional regulator [Bifidobacterium sp. ESL0775]|uniref:ROK family transcriptional regulator n=1 Tax=Bifidobacterium sp. ESL0775 TaxID=2983230 RepID=UPI0023F8DC85|nr:ROK family transcriptional regulator [Bifidobacterium sp. ESL0775]WEV69808.1 ROK family transcriptional regulator [Bifidobacterium sp. ESL0775]
MTATKPLIRGTNLPALGSYNHSVVLETIRKESGISRIDISRQTGLTPQTVSNIVRSLLKENLIKEGSTVTGERGKPPTSLTLNPEGRYAFGVHLEPEHTGIVLMNFAGETVARYHPQLQKDAASSIKIIADTILKAIENYHIPIERISGVGIASPGPLDAKNQIIVNPPNLSGWWNFPIVDELKKLVRLPVALGKDVTAACQGEAWNTDPATNEDFLFIYMGIGVAFGFTHHGEVFHGGTGNEGDAGHLVVEVDGPECWCGQRGCLTVTTDPRAIVKEAEALGLFKEPTHVHKPQEFNTSDDIVQLEHYFDELCERARNGEDACLKLMHQAGIHLGRAATTFCDVLDMNNIVLGGPYWNKIKDFAIDDILNTVREKAVMRQEHTPMVRSAERDEDIAAYGAASTVLDRDLSPNTNSLVIPKIQ